MEAGTANTKRYIPIHKLAPAHGKSLCSVLPAIHHLTGSDYTSKVGTKQGGLQANPTHYLSKFAYGNIYIHYIYINIKFQTCTQHCVQ